jgi:hypothetical protein
VPSRGAVAVGGRRRITARGPAVQGCSVGPAVQGCVPAASCAAQLVLPATVHASPPGGLPRAARAGPATRMALARGPPARLSPQCHQFLRAPSRSRARCRRAACPVQVGDAARRGALVSSKGSKYGPGLASLDPGNNGEMVVIAKIHHSVLVPTHPPSPPPSTGLAKLGAGLLLQPALAGRRLPRRA